jgi:hypothetical protein
VDVNDQLGFKGPIHKAVTSQFALGKLGMLGKSFGKTLQDGFIVAENQHFAV